MIVDSGSTGNGTGVTEDPRDKDAMRDAFDDCVARTDPAMIAVLAEAAGEVDACLVGFHCQCSMEPARYAVWLSEDNHTFRVASKADTLTVHFLEAHQHDLAALVGGTSKDRDPSKVERLPLERDSLGDRAWRHRHAGNPLTARQYPRPAAGGRPSTGAC